MEWTLHGNNLHAAVNTGRLFLLLALVCILCCVGIRISHKKQRLLCVCGCMCLRSVKAAGAVSVGRRVMQSVIEGWRQKNE